MLAHAQSRDPLFRDPTFTSCLRLFRRYPLAVRRHYAEHRYGSMVLMSRDAGSARFFVLIMEWDDLFIIRPWDRRDWARVEIRPYGPASGDVARLIGSSTPVPADGVLLGWVAEGQVRAVLAARGRLPEPWEDASAVPEVVVLPRADTKPAEWPSLTARPLDDGRLWEYVERGQLADLSPVVARRPGCVFWVPAASGRAGQRVGPRVVVTERLNAGRFWLPDGVYADHWTLREGAPLLSAGQLLTVPGVTDLARGCQPAVGSTRSAGD